MAKIKEQKLSQPDDEAQKAYLSLISNDATEVEILRTNKKYRIRWLKNGQLEALTKLLVGANKEKEEEKSGDEVLDAIVSDAKLACKASAIIILDGYWKLKFNYWWMWRWFYYIKQYDNVQLEPILMTGKKKVPEIQFFRTIMSLTEARDSLMRMRAKEVEATLRELNMAQRSATESKDSGS